MKKNYLTIVGLFILSLSFLVACNKVDSTSNEPASISKPTTTATQIGDTSTSTPIVQPTAIKKGSGNIKDSTIKDNKILYKNSRLGFTLGFPQSWKGYYKIEEGDTNYIEVYFIGQSKISKGENGNGLFMFYIGTEEAFNDLFTDGNRNIGNIKGVDYYYATGTDYSLGALDLSTDQSSSENITDQTERKLMDEDFHKAQEMQKDIDGILKTFKQN